MKEYAIMTHRQDAHEAIEIKTIEDDLNANAAHGWEVVHVFDRPSQHKEIHFLLVREKAGDFRGVTVKSLSSS